MKNKITNDQVEEIIGKMAEEIRSDMDYDFRVAQSQMWIAENDLVESLDINQKKLYDEFSKNEMNFTPLQKKFTKRNSNTSTPFTSTPSRCVFLCEKTSKRH